MPSFVSLGTTACIKLHLIPRVSVFPLPPYLTGHGALAFPSMLLTSCCPQIHLPPQCGRGHLLPCPTHLQSRVA